MKDVYKRQTDTSSQSSLSELEVFDRKGNSLFTWKSPRLLLTDIALSPDGSHLAAVGVTAEAGNMRSTLLVFDLADKSMAPVSYTHLVELDVPQPTELCDVLKKDGLSLPDGVLSVDECVEALSLLLEPLRGTQTVSDRQDLDLDGMTDVPPGSVGG